MGKILRIVWHLDEDGGGTANIMADRRLSVDKCRYVFDSLDELPPVISEAIRKDGRAAGEIPINAD